MDVFTSFSFGRHLKNGCISISATSLTILDTPSHTIPPNTTLNINPRLLVCLILWTGEVRRRLPKSKIRSAAFPK